MEALRNCTDCKLYKTCNSVGTAGGSSEPNPDVMVVLDYPDEQADEQGCFTQSESTEKLLWLLNDVITTIHLNKVYITYAIKCRPEKQPTKKEIVACNDHLQKEILEINPKVIIPMGEIAMQSVLGCKGLSKKAGKMQMTTQGPEDAILTIPVVPTYSPEHILKVRSLTETWARHVDKAINIAYDIPQVEVPTKVIICDTIDLAKKAIDYCVQVGVCCFDFEAVEIDKTLETFHPDFYATTLSLTFQIGSAYIIPIEHFDSPFSKGIINEIIMEYFRTQIAENPNVRKIAHNLTFDKNVLRTYGVTKLRGRIDDTMLMHHIYDETEKHGLKVLVEEYLPEFIGFDDEIKDLGYSKAPLKILAQYNGVDTDVTMRLCTLLESYLLEDEKVYKIYRNLSMGVFRTLWNASAIGMLIDKEYLEKCIKTITGKVQEKENALRKLEPIQKYEKGIQEQKKRAAIEEQQTKLDKLLNERDERYKKKLAEKYEAFEKWENEKKDALAVMSNPKKLESYQKQREKKIASLEKWKAEQLKPTQRQLDYVENIHGLNSGEKLAYEGINFGSPKQMENLLYYSEHGFQFSTIEGGTGKDVINDLNDESGFVDALLVYRSLQKTLGTYLEGILKRLDKDNRLHTSFKIHGTVTGRIASANPNLLNIPKLSSIKDPDCIRATQMIKECFVVPKGMKIYQGDYSQVELRLAAFFSGDKTMLDIYARDGDIHAEGAAKMLQISIEEYYQLDKDVQKEERRKAKPRNFGLIYKMSVQGFMEYAKNKFGVIMTFEEAKEQVKGFFNMFSGLEDYYARYLQKGLDFGWVRTLFGRRRRLPNLDSHDDYLRESEERNAANSPIQGTAADFILFAMTLLRLRLDPRVQIVNSVYDSIIVYIPTDIEKQTIKLIEYTCENLPMMQYFGKEVDTVKMKLDSEISDVSWGNLQEYEEK